jgi:preprotein translocase subunit YajC
MDLGILFLQAAAPSGGNLNIFLIGAIILVFYLFMIRPQVKKQKEQQKFSTGVAKGDEVVTNSGIVGKVNKIEGNFVTIESSKSYIKVLSSSISKELTESIKPKATVERKKGLFSR